LNWCLWLCLASAVVLGACFNYTIRGYEVAVGAVSFALTGVMLLLYKFNGAATLEKSLFTLPKVGVVTLEKLVIFFVWVWWIVGAVILTFEGPFLVTSNGYFGCWAALAISTFWLWGGGASTNSSSQAGILVASVILIMAVCLSYNSSDAACVYALIVASLTILYVLLLMATPLVSGKAASICSLILLALWVAAAIWLTFVGPFLLTGNGYFATWLGLFCAVTIVLGEPVTANVLPK